MATHSNFSAGSGRVKLWGREDKNSIFKLNLQNSKFLFHITFSADKL
ncbi:unnamed protein product [Nezara viridula]|uniref:Uncharacterized protein n=1 Tax=Nezara viridula TaxID=85310 RepID=A0A9P0MN65_NEZVI|nr:unnamed protein product [Nezara viridula]